MNPTLSVYLDLCRFLAALLVVLGHVSSKSLTGGLLWQTELFGPSAVAIFFVLSGYVISFVTTRRENDWRSYASGRCVRLYSVVLPVTAAIVLFDTISLRVAPDVIAPYMQHASPLLTIPATLTFTNEFWGARMQVGTGAPFWSLSFEAAYYAAFGVVLFAPARFRWAGAALILGAAGPGAIAMAPLWLLGVALQRGLAGRASAWAGIAAFGAGALILVAHATWLLRYGVPQTPFSPDPNILTHATAAIGFGLTVAGVGLHPKLLRWPLASAAAVIRWLAGATFTLYLLHFPTTVLLASLLGQTRFTTLGSIAILAGSIVVPFVVAQFTERRKAEFGALATLLIRRLSMSTAVIAG